eukprot:TRINITY_DN2379_c2_g1_i1.p1 TRINITY_DN2379_c2_g1~~TRINITY_DN2379_c2_g1_i1.p1  ORF type:complete len:404 (-),score=163.97 TRINITY_DN2379_c2_g1_i1:182-1393(-)
MTSNLITNSTEVHPISLRVMRLFKNGFRVNLNALCEPDDVCSDLFLSNYNEPFGLSSFLVLPATPGKLHLGEEFTCYLSLYNSSSFDVFSISIKAKLENTNNSVFLVDGPNSQIAKLKPKDNNDFLVSHTIKELGKYGLSCIVSYTKMDGEKKSFKKSYEFHVVNPFEINYQYQNLINQILVTVSLKNATISPMLLEYVKFIPRHCFGVTDLNTNINDMPQGVSSRISKIKFLKGGELRQFCFRLDQQQDQEIEFRNSENLGKIEICWKKTMGEIAILIEEPILRKPPQRQEIELILIDTPTEIILEQPFNVTCEIKNRSLSILSPKISFIRNKMKGVICVGISGQLIGSLAQNCSKRITLSLFAIKPGLQTIAGLRVELSNDRKFDFDSLADILVLTNCNSE